MKNFQTIIFLFGCLAVSLVVAAPATGDDEDCRIEHCDDSPICYKVICDADPSSGQDMKRGKPTFMRLGKRASSFMRFGKRPSNFMRFGKRAANFMRFGKRSAAVVEPVLLEHQSENVLPVAEMYGMPVVVDRR